MSKEIDILPERDERPPKGGWVKGWYTHLECEDCGKPFMGAKRAWQCSSCAYKEEEYGAE